VDVKGLRGILTFGVLFLPVPGFAEDAGEIGEVVVTGRRLPPAASELVLATAVIDREALAQTGNQRLDDALRDVPGFSLFRRQSSRASHPTTQGVTLRGLGPSGAGQ
jgi:outer membrane receptor for Fe3+-dicitrate